MHFDFRCLCVHRTNPASLRDSAGLSSAPSEDKRRKQEWIRWKICRLHCFSLNNHNILSKQHPRPLYADVQKRCQQREKATKSQCVFIQLATQYICLVKRKTAELLWCATNLHRCRNTLPAANYIRCCHNIIPLRVTNE